MTAQFDNANNRSEEFKIKETQDKLSELNLFKNTLIGKINSLRATIDSNDRQIQSLDTKMKDVTAKATSVKPGVPCPTCGKPSTEADVEHVKEAFRTQWRQLKAEQATIINDNEAKKKELAELSAQAYNDAVDKQIESLNATIQEYNKFMSEVWGPANGQLASAKNRFKNLTASAYKFGDDIQKIQNDIGELTKRQADLANWINSNSNAVTDSNEARKSITRHPLHCRKIPPRLSC